MPAPPTPARLTTIATARLSRGLLLLLCLAFIFPGLIGRDPWKTEDVIGLGIMQVMAGTLMSIHETAPRPTFTPAPGVTPSLPTHDALRNWLAPRLDEAHPIAVEGPLPYWVGALFIALVDNVQTWLPQNLNTALGNPVLYARGANVIWSLLLGLSVWYGTYLLGRRREIQPMPLPFGGQPAVPEYGRMLADASLLLLIGSLGLLWRSHEASVEPAVVAFYALGLTGAIRRLDRPLSGNVIWALALAASLLARGAAGALPLVFAALALRLLPTQAERPPGDRWSHAAAWLVGIVPFALWFAMVRRLDPDWLTQWLEWQSSWPLHLGTNSGRFEGLEAWGWLGRNMPWFTWPIWPLAACGLWSWRHHLRLPALRIPLSFLVGAAAAGLLAAQPGDAELLALLPPLAMLGAMALPTLRRGLVNALDWFALMSYSFAAGLIWLGWLAITTGFPPKIARNFMRLTPGFSAQWLLPAFITAVIGTLAWLALARWRLAGRPAQLWRGTVLSATGLTLCWLLLMTLWLPSINYSKSYRQVAQAIDQTLRAKPIPLQTTRDDGNCMHGNGVGLAQRASFQVIDGLHLEPMLTPRRCRWLLIQRDDDSLQGWPTADDPDWQLAWQGARARDRREWFLLYRRR